MKKIWREREIEGEARAPVASGLLSRLLALRGLTAAEEIDQFLNPDYERDLHDPFLLLDMERAVNRILIAISAGEKIAIFADYDADGVPAAVILTEFFKQIHYTNFTVYIPDRHEEAYGLNIPALKKLAAEGVKLVITVDCGISDIAPIAAANEMGLDVIVTDHHLPPPVLPEAYAIVNPKREGDPYPFKELAGAGVAFKLVQAMVKQGSPPVALVKKGWEKWLLDLVAVATVADMVPLVGENRALVHFGLKVLQHARRLGLRTLCQALGLESEFLTEDDIGFSIGPRLNSASRMSHGDEAYALLIATDPLEAEILARNLEGKNRDRRVRVDEILDHHLAVDCHEGVCVLGSPDWSLGVLGLVAGRLAERHNRPFFIWGRNGTGEIKGSCRGVAGLNMVELMRTADEAGEKLFINYGGHMGAGGFSLLGNRLAELAPRLNRAHAKLASVNDGVIVEELQYDLELALEQVNGETLSLINQLSPFGLQNPKPVFLIPEVSLSSRRKFGNGSSHLELTLAHPVFGRIRAVQFFAGDLNSPPKAGEHLDLLASLEKSYFRNKPEFRLRLIDWRRST